MKHERVKTNYGEGVVIDSFENAFDDDYPLNRRVIMYKVLVNGENLLFSPDEVIFLDDARFDSGMAAMTLTNSDTKLPFEPKQNNKS